MWWHYLTAIVLLSFAFPLGRRTGMIAPDEVKAGGKYIFLLRDALMLASIAVAAYSHGQTFMQYALPALIIISYFWFWKLYGHIYPFLLPLIMLASLSTAEVFVFNGGLLFLAAFTQGVTEYKQKKKKLYPKIYWPTPLIGAILTIVLLFI
jgi:hypothetical protein